MTDDATETSPIEDFTQAFEAQRVEVSLIRAAVEGLTAARERIPDYSVTLGEITEALQAAEGGIQRIEKSPAVRLSPAALVAEIIKASANARAEDRALLSETRDAMSRSIGRIDGMVERGQAADQQIRWLIWSGVGGFILGIWLWAILPGAVARSLPASWHVPEWMAERTMGMDGQRAAVRLIEVSRAPAAEILPVSTNVTDENMHHHARGGQ